MEFQQSSSNQQPAVVKRYQKENLESERLPINKSRVSAKCAFRIGIPAEDVSLEAQNVELKSGGGDFYDIDDKGLLF